MFAPRWPLAEEAHLSACRAQHLTSAWPACRTFGHFVFTRTTKTQPSGAASMHALSLWCDACGACMWGLGVGPACGACTLTPVHSLPDAAS